MAIIFPKEKRKNSNYVNDIVEIERGERNLIVAERWEKKKLIIVFLPLHSSRNRPPKIERKIREKQNVLMWIFHFKEEVKGDKYKRWVVVKIYRSSN